MNATLNGNPVTGKIDNSSNQNFADTWNDNDRVGRVAKVLCGDAGIPGLPATLPAIVYLDVSPDHEGLTPINPNHVFDNLDLDRLLAFVISREWNRQEHEPRRGILLMGPTGSGKTSYLEQRHAQRGIPIYSITASHDLMAADLLQTKEVVQGTTFWSDGLLLKAMREGVPFLINEGDALSPVQWLALNEIVEKGKAVLPESGEVVVAKRGFNLHVTCNTSFTEDRRGGYSGTRNQNISVLSRFYLFELDYVTPEKEAEFLKVTYPTLPDPLIQPIVKIAEQTRKAYRGDGTGATLDIPLSRRHLAAWAEMIIEFSYLKAQKIDVIPYTLNFVYLNGLPAEQVEAVKQMVDLAFDPSKTA